MFSAAFDVLMKILESYRPQIPTVSTREHTSSHTHTHTCTCTLCDTWRSHTPPHGTAILFAARQLPCHHTIIKLFFYSFEFKINQIKFIKNQKKSLKIRKFITYKIQLQINLNLSCLIRNEIIYHFKNSNLINNNIINFYLKNTLISLRNYDLEK